MRNFKNISFLFIFFRIYRHVYKCIKSARWGDKLPMDVNECTVDTETETTLTTTKTDE